MVTPYRPLEEKVFCKQQEEKTEEKVAQTAEVKRDSRVYKPHELRRAFFTAMFIAFSCLLPYIGDLDCVQNKKAFGNFPGSAWGVWYLCMALFILIGWCFAFVNSRKRKPYHFIFLAPIAMTLLQVLIDLAYLHYFLPFVNRVIANLVVLGVLAIVTVFWLRNKPLKKRYFWPYILITAASVLPYIHWLPYFRNLKGIGSIKSLRFIVDIVAIFLNGILAWIFACKVSGGKSYRFVMLAPIIMLSVQLTAGFLFNLNSEKLFYFQTIDVGVTWSFTLLLLFVFAFFGMEYRRRLEYKNQKNTDHEGHA